MTPDERELITALFDRMRGFELGAKDREAEALINQAVRSTPDAPYMLVQSVLVQEQALEAANNRIEELEARVRSLEQGSERAQQGAGSFLGGLFGGSKPGATQRSVSVPAIGSGSAIRTSPIGGVQPQIPQAAGGSFMRSAMTTAAGVAGGILLAEGIRNMMGGAQASTSTAATETNPAQQREPTERDTGDDTSNVAGDSGFDGDLGGGLDI